MSSFTARSQTVDSVYSYLVEIGVKHPEIVLRQSIQETGWYKCKNCSLSRNNIFGFWYKKKYIEYLDWKDCCRYYLRWQNRHYKGGDYYVFLKERGYASDPNYESLVKALKPFKNDEKN